MPLLQGLFTVTQRDLFVAVERNAPYTVDMFEVPDFMLEEQSLRIAQH